MADHVLIVMGMLALPGVVLAYLLGRSYGITVGERRAYRTAHDEALMALKLGGWRPPTDRDRTETPS